MKKSKSFIEIIERLQGRNSSASPLLGREARHYIAEALVAIEKIESVLDVDGSVPWRVDRYPVGSIYMSVLPTSPAELFGGTWERWGHGRVPVGVDESDTDFSADSQGGAKTHTLTTDQMPAHSHNHMFSVLPDGAHTHTVEASGSEFSSLALGDNGQNRSIPRAANTGSAGNHGHGLSGSIHSSGSGAAHNNLQPYITCYMWRRTA